ncbi:MAG TPA: hypothetical protein VH558_01325 [Pseudolabrys sp.]|jgi:hypothetical protein
MTNCHRLPPPELQYPLQVELPSYVKDHWATLLRHPVAQSAAGIYACIRDTQRNCQAPAA